MTISEIQRTKTREDLIRLIVRHRSGHWRKFRDAVILEVADRTPPVNGFYRVISEEVSQILGVNVSAKICYDVCKLTK